MLTIAALGPAGPYLTRTRTAVADASGTPVMELSSLPELVISDWVKLLRNSAPLPPDDVSVVLEKAADVFEDERILGDTLASHERRLTELTGTPLPVIQECDRLITTTLRDVRHAPCLACLLYTSDAADDLLCVDLGGRRIIKKK